LLFSGKALGYGLCAEMAEQLANAFMIDISKTLSSCHSGNDAGGRLGLVVINTAAHPLAINA
jgi:hypothetical protein